MSCIPDFFCHPEHLCALFPCWERAHMSLAFVQVFKTQEKVLMKDFWDMIRKGNWVTVTRKESPPRRLGAEQGNILSDKAPSEKKCCEYFFNLTEQELPINDNAMNYIP